MALLPARLNKPEYLLRPSRLARRLTKAHSRAGLPARTVHTLPWGLEIELCPREAIGYAVVTGGVFDLCVTETIHRLVQPGDVAVDAGANIGYLTSLMAARAGPAGCVYAFEPEAAMHASLVRNAARWEGHAPVRVLGLALSDRAGKAFLARPEGWEHNQGRARLVASGANAVEVETGRLDEVVDAVEIGLLKIDVEGHQAEVLQGAAGYLERGRVRHVIYEDDAGYPSQSSRLLEGAGMSVFSIDNTLRGLRIAPANERPAKRTWEGPSYLGTCEPERALARVRSSGWNVLRYS